MVALGNAATDCLDDNLVAAFAGGELTAAELACAETHIDTCPHCRSAVGAAADPDVAPMQSVGHFELLRQLGRGGMGDVYVARDSKLGRDVALKIIDPGGFGGDDDRRDEVRRRFDREARAAAAIAHPHVAAVFEVGELEGLLFIAMELIVGQTLREAIEDGLDMPELLRLATEIASGLAAVHEAGIVHRDVKPDNVIVAADGTAKLVDFGLAKPPVPSGDTETSTVTRAGMLLGTPQYMSPEQARGRPASAASDVFSFGATLYEMIGGRRPFGGATPADAVASVLRDEPPSVDTLRPGCPPALREIVAKCLRKDPAERFADGDALTRALAAVEVLPAAAKPLWLGVAAIVAAAAAALWLAGTFDDAATTTVRAETASPRLRGSATEPLKAAVPPATATAAAASEGTAEPNKPVHPPPLPPPASEPEPPLYDRRH